MIEKDRRQIISGPQKSMQIGALCPFLPPKLTKMGGGGDTVLSLARWRQVHLTQLKSLPAMLVTQGGMLGAIMDSKALFL